MAKAAGLVCAFLLLASFCCQGLAQKAPGAPDKCCFTFQTSRIKKGNIVGWYFTNPECSYPAVVFKTRMGKEICANPDKRWVKKYQGFFRPNSLSVPT
ncbi:C-C motif chemokine 13-like [Trachemys scripta elegans]|uniref:C-C motif chemokine n=1 Tax=Chrysemys picta bellii TaxID=8478 RepID=A0A8C3FCG5_CHRPI|nr:C-C motif chemokine 13-like [Chrysemys picta bellii]XP_034608492.1 C-C motif chemokine 13-like [Trachemys scripta elegans]XP_053864384.1 C-C motif chemokine 13-like [Malaclemys terrapin pileata]